MFTTSSSLLIFVCWPGGNADGPGFDPATVSVLKKTLHLVSCEVAFDGEAVFDARLVVELQSDSFLHGIYYDSAPQVIS